MVSFPRSTVVGGAPTAIVTVSFELQPLASVPVTTYFVSDDGETVMLVVVSPVDQLYVEAPVAVNVAESPVQMVWSEPAETDIVELTVIVVVSKATHPKLFSTPNSNPLLSRVCRI